MRHSLPHAVIVAVAAALLLCCCVGAVPVYHVYRDSCAKTGTVPLYCDARPSNDDLMLYNRCLEQGLYLAYITSLEELQAARDALNAIGQTKAYVGARQRREDAGWYWMADGWSFAGGSLFFTGTLEGGAVQYGGDYWLPGYPTNSSGVYVQLDTGAGDGVTAGLRNVGGSDTTAFNILCEMDERAPPVYNDAPAYSEPPETPPMSTPDVPPSTPSVEPENTESEFPVWVIGPIVVIGLSIITSAVIAWCCCRTTKREPGVSDDDSSSDSDSSNDHGDGNRSFKTTSTA